MGSKSAPRVDGMPRFGLGTWQNTDKQCAASVRTALEMGYRHIDTAQLYGNEKAVGEGIARADVDREEVFLATKITPENLAAEDVHATTRASLNRLGVDAVDLLYVHWPAREYEPAETLSAFSDLHEQGLIERIGVSNFQPEQLETALEVCEAPIFANQIELHPMLQQERLRAACEKHDVEIVAYSPLARGDVFDQPTLTEIASKHDVSAAQVSLAWLREIGATPIPKATSEAHIRENFESLELELDDDDLEAIEVIETTTRQVDPSFAPWN